MKLVSLIYNLTKLFPREEIYGLTSQMRRAAVSIPSNIAEGSQRKTRKDFVNFLRYSKSSAAELETQVLISKDLGYVQGSHFYQDSFDSLLEIKRMLSGLESKLIS